MIFMAGEIEILLNEMKGAGIAGAVLSADGAIIASTLALNDIAVSNLTSFANVCDALLQKAEDRQREIEVNFANSRLMIIPIGERYFCALVNSIEDKPKVREYAARAAELVS